MNAGRIWKKTSTGKDDRLVQHGGRLVHIGGRLLHMRNEAHNDFQVCFTAHAHLHTPFNNPVSATRPVQANPPAPNWNLRCDVLLDALCLPTHCSCLRHIQCTYKHNSATDHNHIQTH